METHERAFTVLDERDGGDDYRIRPSDLPQSSGAGICLQGVFDKMEVDRAAERLIAYFTMKGYWCSFKLPELLEFYVSRGWVTMAPFFGLMGAWYNDGGMGSWSVPEEVYIACARNGDHYVTDRFVERCARANEAIALARSGKNVFDTVKNMVNPNG